MDQVNNVKDSEALNLKVDGSGRTQGVGRWKQIGDDEKKAALHSEIARVNQLPSNSIYAVNRIKVLHKILHLMSVKRTISQDEELELLFAGLSL